MAKEVFLTVDGKQVALTDEQLKALGLYEEPKKSPFERVKKDESYYLIASNGKIERIKDYNWDSDRGRYEAANYCTDKELMQQRALHETLNRLLWRFSMENGGSKIDWKNEDDIKFFIYYDYDSKKISTHYNTCAKSETIYFHTNEIAKRAINEIILPFMEEHPEFIW